MKNESIAEVYAMSVADNIHKPYTPNWYVVFDRAFKEKMAELEPKPKPVTYTEEEVIELIMQALRECEHYDQMQQRLCGLTNDDEWGNDIQDWFEENKKQG